MMLPSGIKEIRLETFENRRDFREICIPDSVTSIGVFAFSGCEKLEVITIPNSVETIGMGAFEDCHSLKEVFIPKSVTYIGKDAFRHCKNLERITIEGAPEIGPFAFAECCNVKHIKGLSDSIIKADISSFRLTQDIAAFDIASEIYWTENEDNIPYYVTRRLPCLAYRYTWQGRRNKRNNNIINTPMIIGTDKSERMDIIEELPMAEAVLCFSHIGTKTGKVTAQECYISIMYEWRKYRPMGRIEDILRMMLHDGQEVDDVARHVEDIVIRQLADMFRKISDNEVDEENFDTAITDVINWMSQKQRLRNASDDMKKLILDDMEDWIENNGSYFEDEYLTIPQGYRGKFLENLTTIEIPRYMTFIPPDFFRGFSGIDELTIPETVVEIDNGAFAKCINLKTVNLQESLELLEKGAFVGCAKLQHITMPENDEYVCEGECVIKKDEKSVVLGCANSVIPEYVTKIDEEAFAGCKSLKSITIPNGLETIGMSAFEDCSGLQEIVIPNTVTTINMSAFARCSGLREIFIPKSVKTIDVWAFVQCIGLQRIVFEGAPTIMHSAFAECVNVKTIKGMSNDSIIAYPRAFNITQDNAEFDLPAEIHWEMDDLPF